MNPVLHVQSRAYPTYQVGIDTAAVGADGPLVIGDAKVPVTVGRLRSLAYRDEASLELDVTDLLVGTTAEDRARLVWARMRVLKHGVVLFSAAYEHETDLLGLDRYELCEFDARFNSARRRRDAEAVASVLAALGERRVLRDPQARLGWKPEDLPRRIVSWSAVRYNAHFVTATRVWEPDPRVVSDELPGCSILLPYTFEWVGAGTEAGEVLKLVEPADLAVAQRSVLAGASEQAIEILEALSNGSVGSLPPVGELRRHIDRIRSTYHRLDSYRYDSAQDSRAVYMCARAEMGLDAVHERTEVVLAQVTESIQSEVDRRTMALDGKLNRLAAFFTVATGSALVLDLVEFAGGGVHPPLPWRTLILLTVFVLSSLTIAFLLLSGRAKRGLAES